MSSEKKVFLGIITARGGSKGIPKKNIKNLVSRPLIEYTFNAVKNSKLINRCIVSTDDDEIINFSKSKNMEVLFKRPIELATDTTKSIDVILNAVNYLNKKENYIPDYIITLQPTSPLRTGKDIDNAIELISNDKNADSLVSVIKVPHNFNPYSIMMFNGSYLEHYIKQERIMIRQDLPKFYARNGAAIYITRHDLLVKERKIIGKKCLPYFMPKQKSIDIDDDFDWDIAEYLLKQK